MGGRVAMRPSPTALPKCLRARGVHTVLSERGRYHATTMLAGSLWAAMQPCTRQAAQPFLWRLRAAPSNYKP